MGESRSLGSLIVRLAAEGLGTYKADMNAAADATGKAGRAADVLGGSLNSLTKPVTAAELAMQALAGAGKLVTGAFAAFKAADLVRDMTMAAARFETMGVVMKVAGNNAGYSGQKTQEYAKALQDSGISMLQSRNAITQLATAHIDLSNAQKLGRAAQDLAVVGNVNSSEALGRLIDGIKSGEVEVLKSLGLNVSFEASYKKLAAQMGTTSDKLTEQQKVMARTNTALDEAARYTGIYEESMTTAGKAMTSLTRYWEDFMVKAGDAFLPTLATSVFGLTDALKAMNKELEAAGQSGLIDDVAQYLNGALKTALQTVAILGANVAFVFKGMGREIGALAAQAAAVAQGDFKAAFGIGGIGDMVTEDGEKARAALDKFEQKLLSSGEVAARVVRDRLKTRSERDAGDALAATTAAQAKAAEDAAKATKLQAQEYKALNAEIAKAGFLALAELDSGVKLSEADQYRVETLEKLIAAYQEGKLSLQQYIALEARMTDTEGVKRLLDEAKAAQKSAEARAALRQKEANGIEEWMQSQTEAYNAAVKGSQDALKAAQDEYDQYGLSKSQIAQLTLLTLESTQAKFRDGTEGYNAIQKQIDAQRELIGVLQKSESRDAVKGLADLNKRAASESERYWDDALTRAFESGKNAFEAMWSTVKNTFQSQALKVFVQPVAASLGLSGAATAGPVSSGLSGFLGSATGGVTDLLGSSSMGALDIAGFSMPQIGLALAGLAVLKNLGVFGSNFTSSSNTGDVGKSFSAGGQQLTNTSSAVRSAAADGYVDAIQKSYTDTAKALGIGTVGTAFSYASNNGREAQNPNFMVAANAGGKSYFTSATDPGLFGDHSVASTSANMQLEASRAVLTALQGSDLPKYLAGVFNGITAGTATQDQISNALAYAGSLKAIRTAMAETRTPMQVLKDTVTTGFAELGTSADTFKTDFVAAIDAGIGADKLAQWQALGSALDNLGTSASQQASAIEAAADNIRKLVSGISTSVSDSIFGMQYGLEDNKGKYDMLDVRGARIDGQMRASTDIADIAKLAADQIALLNQSWALMGEDQQKVKLVEFEDRLTAIDDFVKEKGADPVALARAQAKEAADLMAATLKTVLLEALAQPSSDIQAAATSIKAAADTPQTVKMLITNRTRDEVDITT